MAKKIKAWVCTSMRGSRIEAEYDVPDGWDEMSAIDRETVYNEIVEMHVQNNASSGAVEVDES
jgi:hypothetical protein